MKKYFMTSVQMWSFIVSSIIIFILFGLITYQGYKMYGFNWILLGGFPFMPGVLVYINFRDRNKIIG